MNNTKANEVLKSLKKIFYKKASNKYHVSLATISHLNEIGQKRNSKKSKVIHELRSDLGQVDDLDVKTQIKVQFIPNNKSLKLDIPFLSYGNYTFCFKFAGKRIISLYDSKYLLDNLIIKHASESLEAMYDVFSKEYNKNKTSKPMTVIGTIFQARITTDKLILFYDDFQIKKDLITKRTTTNSSVRQLKELVNGKEEKIFNKALVDIRKCPVWIQNAYKEMNGQNQGFVKVHK